MKLILSDSVGHRGRNEAKDVRATKNQLAYLGFDFFKHNGTADQGFIVAINLFQSIIHGHHVLGGRGVDGRIDPRGFTITYLNSNNAPNWVLMPLQGPGFINHELKDTEDNHDYGTNWMSETLKGAGRIYSATYLKRNPVASKIAVNDVSIEQGGDTPDHRTHETGLSCDIRLPRIDGSWGDISNPNTNKQYDRSAMRAQLKALWKQALVETILFNDAILIDEGLCEHHVGHGDHVHFTISPKSK